MESNDFITGRIYGYGSGIRKTYEESFITRISEEFFVYTLKDTKIYIDKSTNYLKRSIDIDENMIAKRYFEAEILSVFPYEYIDQYSRRRTAYLVEYIEKSVLHKHLLEEKRVVEELLDAHCVKREIL